MVLLDNVVQVFVLPDPDRCFPACVDAFKRGQIRAALIHGNRLGLAVPVNGLFKVTLPSRSSYVAVDGFYLTALMRQYPRRCFSI
jgi:hypothetical protein